MQGIDYPNVKVVVQYGMCPDLCSLIQRVGQAAHAPGTKALFIYMVKSCVTEEHVDQRSKAYINDPDMLVQIQSAGKGAKGKQWVGMASVAFVTSMSCLHVEFMRYLGNRSGKICRNARSQLSPSALLMKIGYTTRWYCDRHAEEINFVLFGLSEAWDGEKPHQMQFIYIAFGKEKEDHERSRGDHKKLAEALVAWRENTYDSDALNLLFSVQDILTDDGIGLITKIPHSQLHRDGADMITRELGETTEWGSCYAGKVFK